MLTIAEFGDELLHTQDLDPVYVALNSSGLAEDQLARACLAYWCFYHLGVAAYFSELPRKHYWDAMMCAAVNETSPRLKPGERWPRAAERRHFRGQQAIAAITELRAKYPQPEKAVDDWCDRSTYAGVEQATRRNRGFGQWIAWKVADMAERVLHYDVDFSNADLGIYKDPRQGAALARFGAWEHPISDTELSETVNALCKQFRAKKRKAPPRLDRLVNVQEIETILCKYKSYFKGHYYVGKDIEEIGHGLHGWGDVAESLYKVFPSVVKSNPLI